MTTRRILATMVLILALSGMTHAATLYMPPITVALEHD
jgi:hypothetical protein